jgi:outer membrane protein TolC
MQIRPNATSTTSQAPPSIAQPLASLVSGQSPLGESKPAAEATDTALPINLATALQLSNARPLDVQIAGRQVEAAAAALSRARLLWVPNLVLGTDYFLHTGPQQAFAGNIVSSNRNTFMAGLGPNLLFSFSDAVYAPLSARQDLRARQAMQQAAANDTSYAVTEAYFAVQQARGELAAATIAVQHAENVSRKTAAALGKGYTPPSEVNRANAELGRRKQLVTSARERWRTASAELVRILRLDPSALVEPVEPPFMPVTVIDPSATVDGLIPIALTTRPELTEFQAVVQATLARLKQEKLRPLIPSLAIRSVSTNPSGTLGYGLFGGGTTSGSVKDFGGRADIDMQLFWEFQALGFGNRARVNERRAEYEAATLELFRTQDRVAAEVAAAHAQVRSAAERVNMAEPTLREAIELVNKTVDELGQTRRAGDALILLIRPQEAVAAVQAFAQASTDFFTAIADYNRAQFRLYRALGHPAQCLAGAIPAVPVPSTPAPAAPVPAASVPATPVPAAPAPALPVSAQVEEKPAATESIPLVPLPPTLQPPAVSISSLPDSDLVPSVFPANTTPPSAVWTAGTVDPRPRPAVVPATLTRPAEVLELPPPMIVHEELPR